MQDSISFLRTGSQSLEELEVVDLQVLRRGADLLQ